MARIRFEIADPVTVLTLKSLLEREGHSVRGEQAEVIITDDMSRALELAKERPTLVLAGIGQLREAVTAMQKGVYGYIVVPLLPGEAGLMVRRATASAVPPAPQAPRPLEEVEAEHIEETLRHCKGNRAKAARLLGIGRNTLWRKLKVIEQRKGSA